MVEYVEPLHQDGATVYASVCRLGLEGIVSKRIDAPYRGGRSDAWRKARCARSETFAVIGFSENSTGRLDGLYLAHGEGGGLVYAGSVEKGFGADDLRELEARLRPLITRRSLLAVAVRKPKARWVLPQVQKKVPKRKTAAKRELIDTGTNKLFVHRNERGTSFKRWWTSAGLCQPIGDRRPRGSLSRAKATRAIAARPASGQYWVAAPPLGAPLALSCLIRCISMLEELVEPFQVPFTLGRSPI